MQKRGELLSYYTVIDLVLICIITGILFFFMSDVGKDSYFERSYLARDIALMLESVQGPGTTYISYGQTRLDNYTVMVKDNNVDVYSTNPELAGLYPFSMDYRAKSAFSEIKRQKVFYIASCPGSIGIYNTYTVCKTACPGAAPEAKSSLLLIPLSITSLTDITVGPRYVAEVIDEISRNQRTFGEAHARQQGEKATSDFIIGIRAVTGDVRIRYLPADLSSEALSCQIAQAFKARKIAAGSAPGKEDIFTGKPAVVIELDPERIKITDAASAIMEGMGDAFG